MAFNIIFNNLEKFMLIACSMNCTNQIRSHSFIADLKVVTSSLTIDNLARHALFFFALLQIASYRFLSRYVAGLF